MNRTRLIFFAIIAIALVVVVASLALRQAGVRTPIVQAPATVEVRVVCALPVEPFVRQAAEMYNKGDHKLEGHPVHVTVTQMDGLTAMGRWERDEMDPIPTVWIPDSRYLVELVNATLKETRGRDVFLTGGEYRTRPIAISLFSWGIYQSRADVLRQKYGEIDWRAIHDAATVKGGWPDLGGQPDWGYFKLVVPNPHKNVGGLMAMVAAGGEYYGKTRLDVADVTNPEFQRWLKELMGAVTDFSSLGAYSVENLALFGYSMGDGGQLLESDLLQNMAGIQTRWADPLVIVYPKYLTWFDFPYTIWMGDETSALEKNAALDFEQFILTPDVQKLAAQRGLRPANAEVAVGGDDSLFMRWQAQGAMNIVPRTTAMA
ncbi:MAG TPA: substrate-binding domain-containing protein, partial [Anaerolineae bacterium]|nr:substrate-binding domain-containing protein [Anaerolineae bacterium]